MINIKVNADNINLGFKIEDFNNKIKFHRDNKNQIIITSENLASAIRNQIKENGG